MSSSESTTAVLVVDMVNDFVTGVFGNQRAQAMVPRLAALLGRARQAGVRTIYCNDSHLAGVDAELRLHPEHALRGTWGAELTPALASTSGDYVVTNVCAQHTAADAFFRGYDLVVVSDCVETQDDTAEQNGLLTMQRSYGARVVSSPELATAAMWSGVAPC